jgi:predicted alpha/beta superfamily hydrolase
MENRIILCGALLALSLGACQVEEDEEFIVAAEVPGSADELTPITIGHIDSLESEILGESRDLWIYIPESSKLPENVDVTYPVVYLLDGSAHFHSVSGMLHFLGSRGGNTEVPEMVVVAIPNTDRMRDLTPTNAEGADTSGGGKEFLSFIETELVPYIEETYPVTTYRTFIGHSLGGLTVIDALFTMPELFQNYVAIDPSLWWDEQVLLKRSEAMLNELNLNGKSLFVGVANTMRGRTTYDVVREDVDPSTMHIRSILEFVQLAETDTDNGLSFGWEYYGGDSHGSVPLVTEYDAFRFTFFWHSLIGLSDKLTLDATTSGKQLLGLVGRHYDTVFSKLGTRVLPPEGYINFHAQGFLDASRTDAALAFLNLNLQNYPQSASVHDALGDYFLDQESTDDALQHFNRAVELGAGEETQEKISALLTDD